MGSERSKCLSRWRRGPGRAVVFLAALAALMAGGCGSSGSVAAIEGEKEADVAVLNAALAQELTTIDAYRRGIALLHEPMLGVAHEFLGQDLAHVDALTKTIRGLGGEVEAEAGELEPPGPRSQAEALVLFYEEENAALAQAQDEAANLQLAAPRTLAAALAASHAQHLALLRQGLRVGLAAAAPEAFESGDLPPPVPADDSSGEGAGGSATDRPRGTR